MVPVRKFRKRQYAVWHNAVPADHIVRVWIQGRKKGGNGRLGPWRIGVCSSEHRALLRQGVNRWGGRPRVAV